MTLNKLFARFFLSLNGMVMVISSHMILSVFARAQSEASTL